MNEYLKGQWKEALIWAVIGMLVFALTASPENVVISGVIGFLFSFVVSYVIDAFWYWMGWTNNDKS